MNEQRKTFPDNLVADIDHQGLGACGGYEQEIATLMGRLADPDLQLSQTVRDQMQYRIECLNNALDNRNQRIDNIGGPLWQGMNGR